MRNVVIISANIEKRIQESKKNLSLAEIRAELMIRNRGFLREFRELLKTSKIKTDDEWQVFCDRWRISADWNWDLETLGANTYILPSIHYSIPRARLSKKQPELKSPSIYHTGDPRHGVGEALHDTLQKEDGYLCIRIHPWTLKKHLEYIWTEIIVAKNKVFGSVFSERERRTFGRDLCWYDLHTKKEFGKLTAGKIVRRKDESERRYWKNISRNTVNAAIRRIKNYIKNFAR